MITWMIKAILRTAGVSLLLTNLAFPATAQVLAPATQNITVNGRAMRVWMEGVAGRKAGEPVVILEAGAAAGLQMWRPVFADIAMLAPVLAYDRSGLGQSESDGQPPTVEHVAQTLHALLALAKAPPPYILAGASWGGVLIRGFASLFPKEVAGLVYLDTSDFQRTREEWATVVPGSATSTLPKPQLPDRVPAGIRAEALQIWEYGVKDNKELRDLIVPPVPAAVLISGVPPGPLPPTALTKDANIYRLMQIRHQSEWALSSPAGLLLMSAAAGHNVVQDAPALVIQAIKHVLDHAKK